MRHKFFRKKLKATCILTAIAIVLLLSIILSAISTAHNASAQSTNDEEFRRAVAVGVQNCYTNKHIGREIYGIGAYVGANSIVNSNPDNYVILPTGYTKSPDNKIRCSELFFGGGDNFEGILALYGINVPKGDGTSTDEQISTFLTDIMGYSSTQEQSSSSKHCLQFSFNYSKSQAGKNSYDSPTQYYTNKICYDVKDGKITFTEGKEEFINSSIQDLYFSIGSSGLYISRGSRSTQNASKTVYINEGEKWEDLIAKILEAVVYVYNHSNGNLERPENCALATNTYVTGGGGTLYDEKYCLAKFDDGKYYKETDDSSNQSKFKIEDTQKAIANILTEVLKLKDIAFPDENIAVLYQNYIMNYYGLSTKSCGTELTGDDLSEAQGQGYTKRVRLYIDGSFQMCYVNAGASEKENITSKKVHGVTKASFDGAEVSLDEIINKLNSLTITKLPENNGINSQQDNNNNNNNDNKNKPEGATCSNSSGALGWILCPILQVASETAKKAYDDVIEPSLVTKVELFTITGDKNGTYRAWSTFRDFANIIFALVLLFVIFSQVSGFGIDNYGIKKMLPKLIVMALLVNISFYICQLAIDLSNIVGSGISGIFNQISSSIELPAEALGPINTTGSVAIGIITIIVAGGIGTVLGGLAFWTAIGNVLLGAVPAIIGAVVALLFLWFMLSMRQAVVVIMVALSPIAFVCYALPNTKRVFDSWLKILKGMLLLYPTCGLLMYGGRLVSKILYASGATENNLMTIITAMLAEIAPLFFIPTVVRSAYNATGQLGAAINNLRGRAIGGARNAARNSQRFKRATQRMQTRRAVRAATNTRPLSFMGRYRRAAASSNPIAQAYARWSRDRAASIVQNAQQQLRQRGTNQALAGATPDQIMASEGEARTNTERQLINQANYGSAQFNEAVIKQAREESANTLKRQQLWNQNKYVEGKRNQDELSRLNDEKTTKLYATKDSKGKYTYMESRLKQQDIAISNETTKMYADKYSRMGINDITEELKNSLTDGKPDGRERFSAASEALIRAGQATKVREVLDDKDNQEQLKTFIKNGENRNQLAQTFGSSGDFTLQEYAKHLGLQGASAMSFRDWTNSDAEGKGKSFKASLQEKGIGSMDKDALKWFAERMGEDTNGSWAARKVISAENVSRVAASTTDAATITQLTRVIEQLGDSKRSEIIHATSADRAANMAQAVRDALAGVKRDSDGKITEGNNTEWINQIGTQLVNSPQIAARFKQEAFDEYTVGKTPNPTPTPTPTTTPTPAPTPTPSPTPSRPTIIRSGEGGSFIDQNGVKRDAHGRTIK